MKNKLLFILFCFLSFRLAAQPTITEVASCNSYTLTGSVVGGLPTDIGLYSDDDYSDVINIGFTFNFYGTNYTQCVIGQNGQISFDLSNATGFDNWQILGPLAGNTNCYNSINGPWCDVTSTGTSEPIYTSLQGVAPNRTFAITWCSIGMYDCTTQWITTQVILYETSNIAEVHIGHKTICAGWNGGYAIVGVENASGTSSIAAPGRDYPSTWNATNEAWRFTPVAPTSATYTVASITYAPIPYSTATVYWYDSSTGAYLGTGGSIVLSPSVTTTYIAAAKGCKDTSRTYITLPGLSGTGGSGSGTAPVITSTSSTNPSVCGICDGTTTLHGISPGFIDTIFSTVNGVAQPPFIDSAGSDSLISFTNLCAGVYSYYYKINSCPSNTVTDTLVNPLVVISNITSTNPTICGLCNGTITLYGITPYLTDTVYETVNGVAQAPFVASAGAGGTITFTGQCAGTYSFYYKLNSCTSNTVTDSLVYPPPPDIDNITSIAPSICGDSDASITIYGLAPGLVDTVYSTINGVAQAPYVAAVNADSTITFSNLLAGTYTYYVNVFSCSSNTVSQTIVNPAPVPATFTYNVQLGCTGDEVDFTNTSVPAGFASSWTFGDGATSTATSPSHTYADGATGTGTYNITLTYETYGNPACATSSTQTVSFDHPLVAAFTSNVDTICLGVPITFTNNSIGNSPSYLWDFGDGTTDVSTNPVHTFAAGGVYNVVLTVTDTIPCAATTNEYIDVISIDVHTGVHDTSVCLADSMLLHAYATTAGAIDSVAYLWTPSNNIGEPTDSVTTFLGIGDFTYLVTTTTGPAGCTASDTETIHSYPPVTIIDLTATQTIAYGSSIQLNADGAVYYTWKPNNGTLDNPNINDPIATPVDSITTYTVYGMNLYGCLDSASLIIKLEYTSPEIVPSAFSPNNDGKNDVFKVGNLQSARLVDFRVFNRWGQQIFQTSNPAIGWDGTFNGVPQDIGVYNYIIIVSNTDGTQKNFTGNVTLIR